MYNYSNKNLRFERVYTQMSSLTPKNLFRSIKSSSFNFFNNNFEIKAGKNINNITDLFNSSQNQSCSTVVSKWKLNKVFSKLQNIKFNPQTIYALAQVNNDNHIVNINNHEIDKAQTLIFFAPKNIYVNGAEKPQSIPLQAYNLTNIQKESNENLNSLLEYQASGKYIGKFILPFNKQIYHFSHMKMAFDVFADLKLDLSKLPEIQEDNEQIAGSYQEWLNFNDLFITHQLCIQKYAVENKHEANIFDELSEKYIQIQADKIREFLKEYENVSTQKLQNPPKNFQITNFTQVIQDTLNSINNNPSLVKYLTYSFGKKWNLENTYQKFNDISYHLSAILKYLNSSAFNGIDADNQKLALEKLCQEHAYAPLLLSCQKLLQLLDIKNVEKTIYNNPTLDIEKELSATDNFYHKYKKIPVIGGLIAHNVKYPKSFFGLHTNKDKNDKSFFISENHQRFKDSISPFLPQKFKQEINQSSRIKLINKEQLSVFKANLRKDLNLSDGKFDKLLQPLRRYPFIAKMGIYAAILASFAAYIAAAVKTGGIATQIVSLPVSMVFGTAFGDPLHHLIMFSISILLGLGLTFMIGKDNSLAVFKAIGRIAKKLAKNYKFIVQQIKDYGFEGALAKMQANFAKGNFKISDTYKNSLKKEHDDEHISISKDKTINPAYNLKKNAENIFDNFDKSENDFIEVLENMLDSLESKVEHKERINKKDHEEIKDKNTEIRRAVSKSVRYFSRRGLLGMAIDGGKKIYRMVSPVTQNKMQNDNNSIPSLTDSTESLQDLYPNASEKELRVNAYKHVLLALHMQKNGDLANLLEMIKNKQNLSQEFEKLFPASLINPNIQIKIQNKSKAIDSAIQILKQVQYKNHENIQNLINALEDFKDLLVYSNNEDILNNLENIFSQTLSDVKSILNNMDNTKNKLHKHFVSDTTKQWIEQFYKHILKETEGVTYTNYRFNKDNSNTGIRNMLNYKLGNLFKIIGKAVPWKLLGGAAAILLILKPIINTSPIEFIPGLDKVFDIASKPYELIMGDNSLGINVNATTDVSIDFPAHIVEGVIGTMFVLSNSMTDLVKKASKSIWNASKTLSQKISGYYKSYSIKQNNLTFLSKTAGYENLATNKN